MESEAPEGLIAFGRFFFAPLNQTTPIFKLGH